MIKNNIKKLAQGLLLVPALVLGLSFVPAPQAAAQSGCSDDVSGGITGGADCAKGEDQGSSLTQIFQTVVNIMLFLIGAVAVIMLVIGGIRYVVSGGNQDQVTGAKNTIMYAIIGIVVAFLAYAAVSFVTTNLQSGAG